MPKLYKDGKVCTADPEQIPTMKKAGWSPEPPEVKDEPVPEAKPVSAADAKRAKAAEAAKKKAAAKAEEPDIVLE